MARKHFILLALFSIALLFAMRSEFFLYYDLNDSSLHQVQAEHIADRILSFDNPLDFFIEEWACGFPLFGHYQILPQLTLALVYLLFFKLISMLRLLHIFVALLLTAYPWSLYFSMKRFGLTAKEALVSGLLSLAAVSSIGFGHELQSYAAYGSGLYTQLFGMHFLPWALVCGQEWISGKSRRLFPAVLFLSLLALSHIFLLYFAFLTLGVWWVFGLAGRRIMSFKRLIQSGVSVFAAVSFFLVPMMINSKYHAFSRYEPLSKTDSYGLAWVLSEFLKGGLLDHGRLPILTALVLAGLVAAFRKTRAKGALAIGFLTSLALFFGRTTWGPLADLLPMASDLHYERFVNGIHIFGAPLAGIGALWILEGISRMQRKGFRMAALALCLLSVVSLFSATHRYLKLNRSFVEEMNAAKLQDEEKIRHVFDWIRSDSPGRLYAGMRAGWGNNYRLAGVPVFFHAVYRHLPVIGHLAFGWSLPGDFSVQMNEKRPDHLDLFNVTHILSWRDDAYWQSQPAYLDSNAAVYRNATAGWIDLVETPVALAADKYSFWNVTTRWLKSPMPGLKQHLRLCFDWCNPDGYSRRIEMTDPFHYHLKTWNGNGWEESDHAVFEPVSPLGKSYTANPVGIVSNQTKTDQAWSAIVQAHRPAVAMLKVSYHPFWRARVNGAVAKPFMVSPGYVAVDVPQGRSHIAFFYRPSLYKWLLLLLLPGVLAALFLRDRRQPEDDAPDPDPPFSGKKTWILFFCAVLLLLGIARALKPDPLPLESLPAVGVALQPSGNTRPDRIFMDGIVFDTGLAASLDRQETWSRSYRLDGAYRHFEAWTGLPDSNYACAKDPKAVFEVQVDGKEIYRSPVLTPGKRPRYVKADLKDKNLLTIRIVAVGDSDCTQAAWANAGLKK